MTLQPDRRPSTEPLRNRISADVAAYLAAGGKIHVREQAETGRVHGKHGWWGGIKPDPITIARAAALDAFFDLRDGSVDRDELHEWFRSRGFGRSPATRIKYLNDRGYRVRCRGAGPTRVYWWVSSRRIEAERRAGLPDGWWRKPERVKTGSYWTRLAKARHADLAALFAANDGELTQEQVWEWARLNGIGSRKTFWRYLKVYGRRRIRGGKCKLIYFDTERER